MHCESSEDNRLWRRFRGAGAFLMERGFSAAAAGRLAGSGRFWRRVCRPIFVDMLVQSALSQSVAPFLTGIFMSNAVTGLSLVLAGLFKSIYDVSLYLAFKSVPFHEEPLDRAPQMESHLEELESRNLESAR